MTKTKKAQMEELWLKHIRPEDTNKCVIIIQEYDENGDKK